MTSISHSHTAEAQAQSPGDPHHGLDTALAPKAASSTPESWSLCGSEDRAWRSLGGVAGAGEGQDSIPC